MQLATYHASVSERRRDWIIKWIEDALTGVVVEADFDSGLRRQSFVCGAIIYDRPFLAPLYAYAAKVRGKTDRKVDVKKLPPYIKLPLKHLQSRMKTRHTVGSNSGKTFPDR